MTPLHQILLVEDDAGDARLAMAVMRQLNVAERVCIVGDGAKAMDYLHVRGHFSERVPGHPGVILLDLKMPRVNGFELLQNVRGDLSLRLIPVVVVSSSREDRDVRRAYELGANAFVVKSIDFDAYRAAIAGLCQFWMSINQPPWMSFPTAAMEARGTL
jgi:CheY-like chemotaxis protein